MKGITVDILYAGQVLKPDSVLSKVPINNLSTVYVVKRFSDVKSCQKDAVPTSQSKSEIAIAMRSALLNLQYRDIVERILADPESVENIIATTPGLDEDPAVLGMLLEPELVAILTHPQNMERLSQRHPSFYQAALTLVTAVNEETAKGGLAASGGLSYSMDQMSDEDEDMPEAQARGARGQGARGAASSGPSITASQLAAALQAATGSGSSGLPSSMAVLPSTSAQRAGPSGSGTSISSDFFQQAMAHAQSASSDSALQQLREMGITDENVARQALAATGGDIQAAIDLIFGDGLM